MREYEILSGPLVLTCVLSFVSLSPSLHSKDLLRARDNGWPAGGQDGTGAVIPNATVTISSPTLVGDKTTLTDKQGNYRFANLPPGPYVINVTAKGFTT